MVLIGAVQFRYSVTVKDDGAFRYDRWTGRTSTCSLEQCIDIEEYSESSNKKPPKDKRFVTVTFIDGSQLQYQSVPLAVTRQDIISRAEREKGKRVSDICCLQPEVQVVPGAKKITVKYDDGTQEVMENLPPEMDQLQIKEIVQRQFGKRVSEICCINEDEVRAARNVSALAKSLKFDVNGARKAGYTDLEILNYFQQNCSGGKQAFCAPIQQGPWNKYRSSDL